MKSARVTFLSIALTFVAATIFYFAAYTWLTRKQTGKGPWEVTFTNDVAGVPELIIRQANLGVSNVHVRLLGEKLSKTQQTATVEFLKPQQAVPFGQLLYDDLMFLPGTVTLDVFGHEVELLPRVLVLNRKPVPWASNSTNDLAPSAKLPAEARKQIKGGYKR